MTRMLPTSPMVRMMPKATGTRILVSLKLLFFNIVIVPKFCTKIPKDTLEQHV
jgi:hypothetical protein